MTDFLSPDERTILDAIIRQGNDAQVRRAHLLMLWDGGIPKDEIAAQVGLSARRVDYWLRRFAEERLGVFPSELVGVEATPEAPPTPPEPEAPAPEPISLEEMCRRHDVDMAHARHVAYLAVTLFDLTQSTHRLAVKHRRVLELAGILHNVAFANDPARHHKAGRDIVLGQPLTGVSDLERQIIACTTAFHRKRWKRGKLKSEPSYLALPEDVKQDALALSALLRVADGLDWSQSQTTHIAEADDTPIGVRLRVEGPYADYDAARAIEKADMWESAFGTPLRVLTTWGNSAIASPAWILDVSRSKTPGVEPTDLMSEAGRKVLLFHFLRMVDHEPGTRLGEDIEELHDMRVATRRMRAAFRVFGPFFDPKAIGPFRKGLRRTGRALGAVRDLDVFMERAQHYLDGLPDEDKGSLDPLLASWQAQREEARRRMLEYLDGERYMRFKEEFGAFLLSEGEGARRPQPDVVRPIHVNHVAPRLIYTRYEAVRAYETVLEGAPISTLHALRIDGKRLRYTLEFFREVLGPETKEVIEVVVGLQDHLGALNDADVARGLLREFLKRLIEQAEDQVVGLGQPVERPTLDGLTAYLADREAELQRLLDTFPQVWEQVNSPDMRHRLALAVSVL